MSLIHKTFAGLLEPALIEEIDQVATLKVFQEGDVIVDFGQYVKMMPLLLQGAIKIMRLDETEGELLLYYLEKGETCTMSIACCVGDKKSEIRALAETESTVAMVPNMYLNTWLSKYASWRNFIMNSYAERMNEMLQAVDSLAFSNMEERIESYLVEKAKLLDDRILTLTHQQIATELNTSRVVVSRLLKKLENEHKIVLLRNEIRVLV
ncbi:Crp/Fnr family transcriptional regulator [Sphingobacterium psychroaquaticum]|uniref:CRP/FNR family transcriptional regulator, anaerobic regulatory protein n=1 Tax=Sphingobacterium psychroaquaticum TaxID=561061 RepID=A0A1X7J087_9SPHI|nr:Crp/Fnr family transcriptional regulator [Sphingobacterium psychroaquaticum]QBQ40209.1 Crp/Fnr family transcriptional regulator [Sphingobacterium psychroaquaticum]SMG20902.1 CRP/FNR family transcriptional regulator, anaerobic regulatory protein [Sphingobacterium psychroaquaticum]